MIRVCDGVYVDPETPPAQLALMKTTAARAAERDVPWYGVCRRRVLWWSSATPIPAANSSRAR